MSTIMRATQDDLKKMPGEDIFVVAPGSKLVTKGTVTRAHLQGPKEDARHVSITYRTIGTGDGDLQNLDEITWTPTVNDSVVLLPNLIWIADSGGTLFKDEATNLYSALVRPLIA